MNADTFDAASHWIVEFTKRSERNSTVLLLTILVAIAMLFTGTSLASNTDDTIKSTRTSEEFRFHDLDGKRYVLQTSAGKKALVLIFVTTDCPIANSYQPLLARLHHDFHGKGFEFVMVHEGLEQTPKKLREHATEYSIASAVVTDAEHALAHKVGAVKTPEAFVFGCDGVVLYQGRIDNLYQGFGKKRASATRDDLRVALTEIDSGEKVGVPKTEAVGCSIPVK